MSDDSRECLEKRIVEPMDGLRQLEDELAISDGLRRKAAGHF